MASKQQQIQPLITLFGFPNQGITLDEYSNIRQPQISAANARVEGRMGCRVRQTYGLLEPLVALPFLRLDFCSLAIPQVWQASPAILGSGLWVFRKLRQEVI